MRKFLTGIGLGLGGIAVVLGLTLGAYAVVGDPIRQPVGDLRPSSSFQTLSNSPEPEQTPEQNHSPDDHGGASGGSDDTGSDDHGGSNSGSDDSSGSGSDDSGSDNSGSGSSGSGSGDDHGGDDD